MSWHNPKTNPPEPLTNVLLAYTINAEENDGRGHDVGEGFRLGDCFEFSTGHPAPTVYAWTELPVPPAPESLGLKTNTPGDVAVFS